MSCQVMEEKEKHACLYEQGPCHASLCPLPVCLPGPAARPAALTGRPYHCLAGVGWSLRQRLADQLRITTVRQVRPTIGAPCCYPCLGPFLLLYHFGRWLLPPTQVWASSKEQLQRELGAKTGAALWAYAHGRDDRAVEPPK